MERQDIRVRIEARIHTGSSRRAVELKDGTYHIYTHAKPHGGRANRDAAALVAEYMGVAKRDVLLVKGGSSRDKVFEIKK